MQLLLDLCEARMVSMQLIIPRFYDRLHNAVLICRGTWQEFDSTALCRLPRAAVCEAANAVQCCPSRVGRRECLETEIALRDRDCSVAKSVLQA